MVEGRLRKRVRAVGLESLDAYCDWLFEGDGLREELLHLINAVTTNKTDFFREPDHYLHLEQHDRARPAQAPSRTCAAAQGVERGLFERRRSLFRRHGA